MPVFSLYKYALFASPIMIVFVDKKRH